jgi:hypothetical protein
MANYQIIPNVTFENTKLVADAVRRRLKVPGGVVAHDPIRLSFGEMSRKEPSKVPAPAGLTVSAIDVEAPGVTRVTETKSSQSSSQSRGSQTQSTASSAPQWMFGGGDIKLNILISIYIIDKFATVPKLFQIIMEHEYIHVRDNLTLAQGIGKKIESDAAVKRWLNGDPWTGSAFFDTIAAIWATEAKKLGDALDSGPSYDRHKRDIARLMPR